jgi:hypothetical protein
MGKVFMAQAGTRPESASSFYVNLVGLMALGFSLYMCRMTGRQGLEATLIGLMTYIATLTGIELLLKRPAAPENGLDFSRIKPDAARVFFKLVGLAACYGVVAMYYWVFPEYNPNFFQHPDYDGFYVPYGNALMLVLPVLAVLAVPYTIFLDGVMKQPQDRYYWLGRFLLMRKPQGVRIFELFQLLLSWLGRGFFLALLFVYAHRGFTNVVDFDYAKMEEGMTGLYHVIYDITIALALMVAVAGLSMPLRLMGTHSRSMDPTLFGWWICLFCYQPFKTYADHYILPRGVSDVWIGALEGYPMFQGAWAVMLLAVMVLVMLADVSMGAR